MTAFASRRLDWQPSNSTEDGAHAGNDGVRSTAPSTSETPIQRTDKTDKSPSVSFVSATPKRFQPETGCDAERDGIREQARSDGGNSPLRWGDATTAVEWFRDSEPPAEPFVLVWSGRGQRPAVKITDPEAYWQRLTLDVAQGPTGPRARYGALQDDLKRLHGLFGPP